MPTYIWQRTGWPEFIFRTEGVQSALYQYAAEAAALAGDVAHMSEDLKAEALLDLMVSEAIKTSQIEGEAFDRLDVRSSIRNQLGLNATPAAVRDPRANGIAALMIAVRNGFHAPLTKERLFAWHDMVITDPYVRPRITVGAWRKEPMRIVSGAVTREKIHFEAPPPEQVPVEMDRFIDWFNATGQPDGDTRLPGPVRAAIVHLYFEAIHPFDDGNGRIGRALSEIALAQDFDRPVLMSLSTAIEADRKGYYTALEQASSGPLDITPWIEWFVRTVLTAQLQAKGMIAFVLAKARYWKRFDADLNDRQRKVIDRMFREGPQGFEGGMSARKYEVIADCSKATATRDLADLLTKGALRQLPGGGRSTRYELTALHTDR